MISSSEIQTTIEANIDNSTTPSSSHLKTNSVQLPHTDKTPSAYDTWLTLTWQQRVHQDFPISYYRRTETSEEGWKKHYISQLEYIPGSYILTPEEHQNLLLLFHHLLPASALTLTEINKFESTLIDPIASLILWLNRLAGDNINTQYALLDHIQYALLDLASFVFRYLSPLACDQLFHAAINSNSSDTAQLTPSQWAAICRQPLTANLLTDPEIPSILTAHKKMPSRLHLAAVVGNVEFIKQLTKICPQINLNEPNEYGDTALHLAARRGHPHVVRLLIQCGADIDACNDRYETPLHYAAMSCSPATVQIMMDAKPNIAITTKHGLETALHEACYYHCAETITVLTMGGLDILARIHDGQTALHIAAHHANGAVIAALIQAGAPINALCNKGNTPLLHAIFNENLSTLTALIQAGADVNSVRNPNGECSDRMTPLYQAVLQGNIAMAKALILAGADVNRPKKFGFIPLHAAASQGNLAMVSLLIEANADTDIHDTCFTSKKTPLHKAAYAGHHEVVSRLLDAGAWIDSLDANGMTPLYCAVSSNTPGCLDTVQVLIQRGANTQIGDEKQNSLLHALSTSKHSDMAMIRELINKLLATGINPHSTNAKHLNQTPIEAALHHGNVAASLVWLNMGYMPREIKKSWSYAIHRESLSPYSIAAFIKRLSHESTEVLLSAGLYISPRENPQWYDRWLRKRIAYNKTAFAEQQVPSLFALALCTAKQHLDIKTAQAAAVYCEADVYRLMPIGYTPLGDWYVNDALQGDRSALLRLSNIIPETLAIWFKTMPLKEFHRYKRLSLAVVNFRWQEQHHVPLAISEANESLLCKGNKQAWKTLLQNFPLEQLEPWLEMISKAPETFYYHETYKQILTQFRVYQAYWQAWSDPSFAQAQALVCSSSTGLFARPLPADSDELANESLLSNENVYHAG